MKKDNKTTNNNQEIIEDIMLKLMGAMNADHGENMKKMGRYAYVMEHHKQALFQVTSGRRNGCWKTHYYVGDDRKILVRRTKEEILDFLYAFYKEGEGANKTLGTVFNELMNYKRKIELCSEKTIQDYEGFFKKYMLPLSEKKISSLTEETIREWITDDVLPRKPKDSAFKRLLIYINRTFWFARKQRYITSNPCEFIEYRDYRKHCDHTHKAEEDTYFTEAETEMIRQDMLKNISNPRALIALLNIETGMRADEPVAIHCDDIHDDYIDIHRQQLRHDETSPAWYEDVDYTKDTRCKDGSSRHFPITPAIRRILDKALELPGESIYLFHDNKGNMIAKDSYGRFFRRHCLKLGLKKTNNHALRKGLNNNCFIPLGFSPNERAALLGHTVRTNEQNYSLRRSDMVSKLGSRLTMLDNTRFAGYDTQ